MTPRPTLTPEEQAAIMLFDKPVTRCPPGGYESTFKQGLGNLTATLSDRGTKVGKKGSAN
jgi:hypothetical protein